MLRETLIENLKDPEYRRHFVSAHVRQTVTSQIRELRTAENRGWTQADLGLKTGMKANAISRLENPSYGDFTINTLLRVGEAFDVGLIVRYVPMSELVEWNQSVTPSVYTPSSFSLDFGLSGVAIESQRLIPPDTFALSRFWFGAPFKQDQITTAKRFMKRVVSRIMCATP